MPAKGPAASSQHLPSVPAQAGTRTLQPSRLGLGNFIRHALPGAFWLPAVLAMAAFLGCTAWILFTSIGLTEGHLIYVVDDAYIHMAIAKNLVLYHVYGVTRHEFTSASSSILWPWLLAGFDRVFGIRDWLPLAMNIVAGLALLWVANLVLFHAGADGARPIPRTIALLALVVAAPLPVLAVIGMENILHALCVLALAYVAARSLSDPQSFPSSTTLWLLGTLAALSTAVRYEGASEVAVVAALFVLRRRYVPAALVALCGLVPIVAEALFLTAHHLPALPYSVLLKAEIASGHPISGRVANALAKCPLCGVLLLAAVVQIISILRAGKLFSYAGCLLIVTVVVMATHMLLSDNYSVYRYQAYIVILGIVANAAALLANPPSANRKPLALLAPVAALVVVYVSNPVAAYQKATLAPLQNYRQQYLDAHFINTYYKNQTVMVNDIGAVCYYADIDLVDTAGLGSPYIARLYLSNSPPDTIRSEWLQYVQSRRPQIAIVFPGWLPARAPEWQPVAQRTAGPPVIAAEETLLYVATDPSQAQRLRASCQAFWNPSDGAIEYNDSLKKQTK